MLIIRNAKNTHILLMINILSHRLPYLYISSHTLYCISYIHLHHISYTYLYFITNFIYITSHFLHTYYITSCIHNNHYITYPILFKVHHILHTYVSSLILYIYIYIYILYITCTLIHLHYVAVIYLICIYIS